MKYAVRAKAHILRSLLFVLLACIPAAGQKAALELIEGLPAWYLAWPDRYGNELLGIGVSDGFGTLQQRRQQAKERAGEALGRTRSSAINSLMKDLSASDEDMYIEMVSTSVSLPVDPDRLIVLEEVLNERGIVFALAVAQSGQPDSGSDPVELRSYASSRDSVDTLYEEELLELRRPNDTVSFKRSKYRVDDEPVAGEDDMPEWSVRPHALVGVDQLAGVGLSSGYPLYWATLMADQMARIELARSIDLTTDAAVQDYMDTSATPADKIADFTQYTVKTTTQQTLENSRIIRRYVSSAGRVYSLATLGKASE